MKLRMGTDIHGVIEVNSGHGFEASVLMNPVEAAGSGIFALLFGVRASVLVPIYLEHSQQALISPVAVAHNRGLPIDCDPFTRTMYERCGLEAHSPSFIYWNEILDVDWNVALKKATWYLLPCDEHEAPSIGSTAFDLKIPMRSYGVTETVLNRLHHSIFWQSLFIEMEELVREYGIENVRLVVWFDG